MNVVTLFGCLGSKPNITNNAIGKVAKVSIATNEFYTENGERKQRTDWHKLVFYDRLAEIVEKYLDKGSAIVVRGKLRSVSDENKNNYTYVQVMEFFMVGSKNVEIYS